MLIGNSQVHFKIKFVLPHICYIQEMLKKVKLLLKVEINLSRRKQNWWQWDLDQTLIKVVLARSSFLSNIQPNRRCGRKPRLNTFSPPLFLHHKKICYWSFTSQTDIFKRLDSLHLTHELLPDRMSELAEKPILTCSWETSRALGYWIATKSWHYFCTGGMMKAAKAGYKKWSKVSMKDHEIDQIILKELLSLDIFCTEIQRVCCRLGPIIAEQLQICLYVNVRCGAYSGRHSGGLGTD